MKQTLEVSTNMKILLPIIFFLLLCSIHSNAQTTDKNNALSLELGKTGLIYNLAYDHKFQNKDFGFRLSAGSNFSKYLNAALFSGGAYYLLGKRNSFFESGVDFGYLSVNEVSDDQKGFSFIYPDYSTKTYHASLNIGYRKYSKGTLFRIGFSPGISKQEFIPGGYLSFGLTF
ncbi:MAG: hypothetical protein ABUT20_54510 [Bacteroidota bacterium]